MNSVKTTFHFFSPSQRDKPLEKVDIFAACENGELDVVQAMIDSGKLNINIKQYGTRKTMLHIAIEKGNMELVKLILAQPGIKVSERDHEDKTAYDRAIFASEIKNLLANHESFSERISPYDYEYLDPSTRVKLANAEILDYAIKRDAKLANELIDHPLVSAWDHDELKDSTFFNICAKGNSDLLLRALASPRFDDLDKLNKPRIVKVNIADVRSPPRKPGMSSFSLSPVGTIEREYSPLLMAVNRGGKNIESILLLLNDNRINVETSTEKGNIWHLMAEDTSFTVDEMMKVNSFTNGYNLEHQRNYFDKTPLDVATAYEHIEAVQYLKFLTNFKDV